ncbi:MAG: type II toxin-antitoxin system RelE/ParE family toxin [Patescibacteria group bacterium]
MKLNIEYYKKGSGVSPIQDFVEKLPYAAKAKTIKTFLLLEDYGLAIGMPHVKSVVGIKGAWELRIKANTNIYRYFFVIAGNKVIILHSFCKKSQEIPKKELKIFKNRLKEM